MATGEPRTGRTDPRDSAAAVEWKNGKVPRPTKYD